MNLSIKNVPDAVVELLRERAVRNHRSLQGELAAIVEAAAIETAARDQPNARRMNIREVYAEVEKLGLKTPGDAAAIVRADRDRDESR